MVGIGLNQRLEPRLRVGQRLAIRLERALGALGLGPGRQRGLPRGQRLIADLAALVALVGDQALAAGQARACARPRSTAN